MKDKMPALESVLGPTVLDKPPHILSQIIEIVEGDLLATPSEQEQLLAHLIECEYCQIALEMLLDSKLPGYIPGDTAADLASKLLARCAEGIKKRHEHYEQIAAYIEMIEEHGEEEASKKYPFLAKHLKQCKDCQFLVESTRTLLDQMKEVELNQEEKVDTKYV